MLGETSNASNVEPSGCVYEAECNPSSGDVYHWNAANEMTNQLPATNQSPTNQFQVHYQTQNAANAAQYASGGSIPFQWHPNWNNQSFTYQNNTQNINYYEQYYHLHSDGTETSTYYHYQ